MFFRNWQFRYDHIQQPILFFDLTFSNCGYLEMEDYPHTTLQGILENFQENDVPSEMLSSKQLKEKYHFDFPESVQGLLERTGGILLASKCLRAVQVIMEV